MIWQEGSGWKGNGEWIGRDGRGMKCEMSGGIRSGWKRNGEWIGGDGRGMKCEMSGGEWMERE